MHFQKISCVLIWSANYRTLANWYIDVFDFDVADELSHPQDTGVQFRLPGGGPCLWIGQHSKFKGRNANPEQIMFNIDVDSVRDAYDYLINKKVKCIAKPFKAPTFDKYFATFQDPDGNIFQIIGRL